ncbi:PREDICTED: uncharacterized protein LOC108562174 isoform X2 [Nicrophorus vespilloides]|uniref:Uncharacterized protein LOC108562174 isoform X2 n=1 Tax=Nicrophorus vespilloides TaxID=110193 RepID=A0ABM1MMW6_NICVS|nr:PREDICTED: uncharacterized protein LOC108562174 isoform X2 [Nicrophorus vespilloides]
MKSVTFVQYFINNERYIEYMMDSSQQNVTPDLLSSSVPTPKSPEPTMSQIEMDRIELYNSYDVMTGIRIAVTLGGFFGLMVILVVYKSKSKTEKALEDPKLAAAAVAEAEEEERQMAAAYEATVYEQLNPPTRRTRRSLDTVGGYSSLMEPPTRITRLHYSIDEDSPIDDKLYDDLYACYNRHLDVPGRRPSNITCSSSGSSYLERRGSSVILGLPAVPAHKNKTRRRQSSPLPEQYDFYYPIDIRVIQPTPGGSPCGSERALYDEVQTKNLAPRLAPLASISSCNTSFANDYPDLEVQSYASDSVFHDLEYCEDTDDEVDPFSTDSEEDARPCCSRECRRRAELERPLPTISDESTSTLIENKIPLADSASTNLHSQSEPVWSQETLF